MVKVIVIILCLFSVALCFGLCRAASVADNTMEKIMREKEFQALDGDKANDVEEN